MKAITSAEFLKLVSDLGDHAAHGQMVRRAVAEVFRLRRKIAVGPPVRMHGKQVFTISKDCDPDKIAMIFERDIAKLAENRIQARVKAAPDIEHEDKIEKAIYSLGYLGADWNDLHQSQRDAVWSALRWLVNAVHGVPGDPPEPPSEALQDPGDAEVPPAV